MKKNVTSFLFFIVIYASAFSNQKCIKNCKNHNKNTGKQVCWASLELGNVAHFKTGIQLSSCHREGCEAIIAAVHGLWRASWLWQETSRSPPSLVPKQALEPLEMYCIVHCFSKVLIGGCSVIVGICSTCRWGSRQRGRGGEAGQGREDTQVWRLPVLEPWP